MSERSPVRMLVMCVNASGEADVHLCTVHVTVEEYREGQCNALAEKKARDAGFASPMLAFDPWEARHLRQLTDEDLRPTEAEEQMLTLANMLERALRDRLAPT